MHPTFPSYTFSLTIIAIIIVTQTECTAFNPLSTSDVFIFQLVVFFGGDKIIELKDRFVFECTQIMFIRRQMEEKAQTRRDYLELSNKMRLF